MNREAAKRILKSPLGRRLFAAIVLFSSLITLAITSIQLHSDYQDELSAIDSLFKQVHDTHLQSLSQSVWVLDDVQIEYLLKGILGYPSIDQVIIRDNDSILWQAGQGVVRNPISASYPLTYEHRGKQIRIAELELAGSLNEVYYRLLHKLAFILGSNLLKTFLVALFILFVFYHLLGQHLIKLASHAEQLAGSRDLPPFRLERRPATHRQSDELDILTRAINQMVDKQQRREDDLRIFETLIDQSPNAIVLTDQSGIIEYTNHQFTEISGYGADEVKGKCAKRLMTEITPEPFYQELMSTIQSGNIWEGEFQSRKKNGAVYWERARIAPICDRQGRICHFLAIKEDISLRKSYEEKLLRQANFDNLTKLPNRLLAFDRISQAIVSHQRDKGHVAILFIDLDRFKNVNDTLGHSAGDQLLISSAQRLRKCVRIEDTVARLGGDEFLLVLSNITHRDSVGRIANNILQAFSQPFQIEEREVYVSASIGITFYPDDGEEPQTLLRNADAAMYQAKAEGRNTYRYFTQAMNEKAQARLEIESQLRNALANAEFELHYQPILEASSGQIIAAEALLRWHNQTLGSVPPDRFIPLAEDIGLIQPIGSWVLRTACAQALSWRSPSGDPLRIAVNVSVRQFTLADLGSVIRQILQETGFPAERLDVEVTEGLLLEDIKEVQTTLNRLIEMGVRLSIDDFGTGYSALGYLKRFPFNVLKIDRSFVRDLEVDQEDAKLANAIIMMAHGLNIEVIGEGVETPGQYRFLRDRQIDMVQGYLFSKPLPAEQFEQLLTEHRIHPHKLVDIQAGADRVD